MVRLAQVYCIIVPQTAVLQGVAAAVQERRKVCVGGGGGSNEPSPPPVVGPNFKQVPYKGLGKRPVQKQPFTRITFRTILPLKKSSLRP